MLSASETGKGVGVGEKESTFQKQEFRCSIVSACAVVEKLEGPFGSCLVMLRRCIGGNVSSVAADARPMLRTMSSSAVGNTNDGGSGGGADADAAPADTDAAGAAYRERLIMEILSRDKEIFELKRQHELSMLRVEQNQRRTLKDQEDRGMYYEQNCNVHTFDTVSVGLYTQRSTLYHTMSVERLRNVKLFVTVLVTLATCFYLYYRYMINPEWVYVEKPMKLLGSRVGALNALRVEQEEKEEEERSVMRLRARV